VLSDTQRSTKKNLILNIDIAFGGAEPKNY